MMGAWPAFARGFVSRAVRASWLATIGEVGVIRLVLFYCAGGGFGAGWVPLVMLHFTEGDSARDKSALSTSPCWARRSRRRSSTRLLRRAVAWRGACARTGPYVTRR